MIDFIRRIGSLTKNLTQGRYAPDGITPFVIVFSPRTGSNHLASLLDSHPDILCHHEVFNPEGIHRALSYKASDLTFGSIAERDEDPWRFMRRVYSFSGGKRAVGFKIAPRENEWALVSLLLARSVRKIVLSRRSWLHAYTSGLIATQTHVWSQTSPASAHVTQPKVSVDPRRFLRYARRRRLFYGTVRALLRATAQRALFVDYEDLSDPAALRRVLQFLGGSDEIPLRSKTAKQNSPRLVDRIENYPQVCDALAGTRYAVREPDS